MAAPPLSFAGVYESLRIPTLRDLVFSAKAYLAAAVALFIGFSQGLEKPYWAVLTIYSVLTPPESGAIRSKAMFRLIGTLAGGVMMIGLTALFGDQLGILVTATIAVVTLATFLRQADRTPSNYLWFSTGITMAVIGLTNLMQPENVFAATTARVAEITLGILVVTAVDAMFWPRPMTPDFLDTMTKWRGDVQHWVLDALSLTAAQTSGDERRMALRQGLRDLTKAVGEIDGKAVQLPYDVVAVVPRRRQIDLVRRQTVSLIADLAGIEIWARSLRRDLLLHSHLGAVLDAVTDWVRESHAVGHSQAASIATRGDALIADLQARRAALDPRDGRTTLTERGLITRLAAFVRDWSDLLLALRSVETGEALPRRLDVIARAARPVRSVDYLGAVLDILPMVLSMTSAAVLWYCTAWNAGGGALLFSLIGCVFLIGQGQVLRSSAGLMTWIITAFAFVFLYQFAILPRVTDFPVLIAVLGCLLLPAGLLMTMSMAGMLICVYVFSFLGLQDAYAGDFNQSLQTLNGSLVGLMIAIAWLHACNYDRGRFSVRRLVGAARQDVYDIARARHLPDPQRFLFLAIDRLALYFPAAELVADGKPLPRLRMIDDFAVGMNLMIIRAEAAHMPPVLAGKLEQVRREVARVYERHRFERPLLAAMRPAELGDDPRGDLSGDLPGEALLVLVDDALEEAARTDVHDHEHLLEALTGLTLALADIRSLPPGPIAS